MLKESRRGSVCRSLLVFQHVFTWPPEVCCEESPAAWPCHRGLFPLPVRNPPGEGGESHPETLGHQSRTGFGGFW